jgi:hypothetical protein
MRQHFKTIEHSDKFINVMYQSNKRPVAVGAYANQWAESRLDGTQYLVYASFVGSSSAVQALIAACRKGEMITRPSSRCQAKAWTVKGDGGQGRSFTEKLSCGDHNLIHGIWVSAHPAMIIADNDQSAFKILRERFNVPGLSTWGEKVMEELRAKELLTTADSFGCEVMHYTGSEGQLDQTVSDLVSSGQLQF